jgi:Tfp pilus assembly protein FimT
VKAMRNQRGVTILEVFIVVSLVALLSATASPFLINFVLKNHLNSSTNKLVGTIRKSQQYAMAGKDGENWGICQQGQEMVLFSNSCAASSHSESFHIPDSINLTGFSEISFNKRGEPSSELNVILSSSIENRQVFINKAGGMEIN